MSRRSSISTFDGASAQSSVNDAARWRRWCATVLIAAALGLGAVLTVNWTVDPFQQYRLASSHPPRFYRLLHRWINPGLAKNAAYNTVLIGSSIMENTPNDMIGAACGGPAVNLSMGAISAAEIRIMLETVFRARDPRRVILVLDFNAFAGPPDARQEIAGPLPMYLYDTNVLNDLPYLLSGTVLRKSISILLQRKDEAFTTDPNAPWWWGDKARYGTAEVMRGLDLGNINAQFQQPSRTLSEMRASFEANIVPIVRAHPETEFELIWPPYSILVWIDFSQRRQLDVTLEFKRYVIAATRALHNVHIIDPENHPEITEDLDSYKDLYHFAPQVNRWLIQRTCSGLDRVNTDNVDSYESQLRERIRVWRPPAREALLSR
jgi:hypothetical protein